MKEIVVSIVHLERFLVHQFKKIKNVQIIIVVNNKPQIKKN